MIVELHKGSAGDGFGDGGHDVDGLGGRWFLRFKIGETIGVFPKKGRVADDAGRHAWVMADAKE